MSFRDTLVTCQECGKSFVYTVEKQRQRSDRGQPAAIPETCEACTQRVRYDGKLHGQIKWFSLEKGYGFIAQDGGGEIFVHRQSVQPAADGQVPALEEGQEVLYETMDTPKGPQAIRVTPCLD